MSRRLDWRIAIRDSDLHPAAKHVALTLDTYMNRHGIAWPSRASLAAGTGRSISTVQRALVALEQAGFIAVAHSRGRRSNLYSATIPNEINDEPVNEPNSDTVADVLTGSLGQPTGSPGASNRPNNEPQSRKEAVSRSRTADHEGDQNQNPVDPAVLELARRWLASHPM